MRPQEVFMAMWTRLVMAVSVVLVVAAPGLAQPSEIEAVKQQELARLQAMEKNDFDALERLLAGDLVYVHSSGTVDDKTKFLDALRSGRSRYVRIVPEVTNVRVFGDIAVINGRGKFLVHTQDQKLDLSLSYLDVWAKRDGRWQMIAWQSARLP
jgi:ketosteroid isomerase-like protein